MSFAASPYSFSKTAMQAPQSLTTTIENLSSWPQYKVPNFIKTLQQFNYSNHQNISSIALTIQVKSPSNVLVTDVSFDQQTAIPQLDPMIQAIKTNIPKYFQKYPETINDVPTGIYTAVYQIPVPEAGAANRQG